jgi:hypothetical protein
VPIHLDVLGVVAAVDQMDGDAIIAARRHGVRVRGSGPGCEGKYRESNYGARDAAHGEFTSELKFERRTAMLFVAVRRPRYTQQMRTGPVRIL